MGRWETRKPGNNLQPPTSANRGSNQPSAQEPVCNSSMPYDTYDYLRRTTQTGKSQFDMRYNVITPYKRIAFEDPSSSFVWLSCSAQMAVGVRGPRALALRPAILPTTS